jgi:hypothetical protein
MKLELWKVNCRRTEVKGLRPECIASAFTQSSVLSTQSWSSS